jgi:radical SAM protein with 4Fe4S-binding SPASM domain
MSRILQKGIDRVYGYGAQFLYSAGHQWAIPTQLGLCLTSKCNLRCAYCMRETVRPPEGALSLGDVRYILKTNPTIKGVCIMGLCEPFLNIYTPRIVRWLKEQGYSVSLTTNGTIPRSPNKLDALTFVDDFVFSIDTHDPETFTYLRGGAHLPAVMRHLEKVIEFKMLNGRAKADRPPIHINAVITEHNFHHIPGLIRMLEPYAESLTYLMVDPVTRPDNSQFQPLVWQRDKYLPYLQEFRRIARSSPLKVMGLDWLLEPSFNWRKCHLSWFSPFVQPNGDVYFCYNYEAPIGNVFKEPLYKIWNNQKARSFRRQLRSSRPPIEQCRTCNFARERCQPEGDLTKKMQAWTAKGEA